MPLSSAGHDGRQIPLPLMGHRVEHIGVQRIHMQLPTPGVITRMENVGPCLAPIRRLEDAPVTAGLPVRPIGGDPDSVRILRVDDDLTDLLRLPEAFVGPARPAIGALVDPVSRHEIGVGVVLAGAYPDHVRIRRIQGNGADGKRGLPVKDRCERRASVGGLPE